MIYRMIIRGKIVPGFGVATKTLKQQAPFFEKGGIKREYLINGSINVDISPTKWKIINPDFSFKNIVWRPNFPEDFDFIRIKIMFNNKMHDGLLYNPKRTRNPKTIMEILAKQIKGIKYGEEIELIIPEDKIILTK